MPAFLFVKKFKCLPPADLLVRYLLILETSEKGSARVMAAAN